MSKEITKVAGLQLPEHLAGREVEGTEEFAKIIRPPRLKIIQKSAKDDLLETFGRGSTILNPGAAVVAELGDPFYFVPIFNWREWTVQSDFKTKPPGAPFILDRSLDSKGEIARRAEDRDQRVQTDYVWTPNPTDPSTTHTMTVRNVSHINFVVMLWNHPLEGEVALMSFSKGEYGNGCNVAAKMKMRKASIFYCVFQAVAASGDRRVNADGQTWLGWDVDNPHDEEVSAWLDAENCERTKALYDQFREAHENRAIAAEYEDVDEDINEEQGEDEF